MSSFDSALPREDVDRMMREAEQYAEEDRRRREEAEVRNQGESLVYQTEKFLKENDEKVPDDVKTEVTDAVAELKKALEGKDVAAIREASEKVATTSQKMGQALYANAEAAKDAEGAAGPTAGGPKAEADDDVVEAEIVDEDKPQREGGAA